MLDATILFAKPEKLGVTIAIESLPDGATKVTFPCALLNKGEFFLVKFLLEGSVAPGDLLFQITADDLPRTIRPRSLPFEAIKERSKGIEWVPLVIGIACLLLSSLFGYGFSRMWQAGLRTFFFSKGTTMGSFLDSLVLFAQGLGTLILLTIGVILILISFEGWPRRGPRFPLPPHLRHYQPLPLESLHRMEEVARDSKEAKR